MSLFKGSFSASFFKIVGAVPNEGFHDRLINQVKAFAFREPADSTWAGVKRGWSDSQNPLITDKISSGDWIFEPYVVLSMRIDTKRLPAKIVKAKLEIQTSNWSKDHDGAMCPRSVRVDLQNILKEEMLKKQPAKVSQVIGLWNIEKGTLVLDSTSKANQDSFRSLFKETFAQWAITIESQNPLEWATKEAQKMLAGVVSQPLTDEEVRDQLSFPYEKLPPFGLTSELLVWIAYMARNENWPSRHGGAVEELEVWVDDKIVFSDENKNRVAVSGLDTAQSKSSLAALAKGQMPKEMRLGVRRGEYEWSVVLKGSTLDWSGAKLPQGEEGDIEELVHERGALIAALSDAISVLVALFCGVRSDIKWANFRKNMRAWAQDEIDDPSDS